MTLFLRTGKKRGPASRPRSSSQSRTNAELEPVAHERRGADGYAHGALLVALADDRDEPAIGPHVDVVEQEADRFETP
jgi:predicted trehalose synthase